MQIAKDTVVTIDYTLKDDQGTVLDSSEGMEPLVYLHGNNGLIPGLEKALEGKSAGEALEVSVAPNEAYGERDESKVQSVPRTMFPEDADIQVGQQYHAADPGGQSLMIVVVDVNDAEVKVDGNHPLAGMNLNFNVSVKDVREATAEELAHGHVHGPGGHHHD